MPSEYVGKDVAIVAMDNILVAYYEGKQVAVHRISRQKKDMVIAPNHYANIKIKERAGTLNPLMKQEVSYESENIQMDLTKYDEVLHV